MAKERILYLDALRGLAMLFVVMGHISLFCYHKPCSGLVSVVTSLEIPLFFLISGYFSYKPSEYWKSGKQLSILWQKVRILVIPALIFMAVYVWLQGDVSFKQALYQPYKDGYWFTLTLFCFYLVYLIFSKVVSKNNLLIDSILILGGVIALFGGVYFIRIEKTNDIITLLGLCHLKSFIWFILGLIWHKHSKTINNGLKNEYFITIICIVFFIGCMFSYGRDSQLIYIGPSSTIYFLLLTLAGLCLTVILFQKYEVLSGDNIIGRFLRLSGIWSLEIYFIHYFLLPRQLTVVGNFFQKYPNEILQFTSILLLAAFVMVVSILIAKIISTSSILSWLLFGKKIKWKKLPSANESNEG